MAQENEWSPDDEARVIPTGEPVEGGAVLFAGSLRQARGFVASMIPEHRREVSIWTPGHIFTVEELLTEDPGHEHDPLSEDDEPSAHPS